MYTLPRMDKLHCYNCKGGIMEYREYGWKNPQNGYYCEKCGKEELDKDYPDIETMLAWQRDRIAITKNGEKVGR